MNELRSKSNQLHTHTYTHTHTRNQLLVPQQKSNPLKFSFSTVVPNISVPKSVENKNPKKHKSHPHTQKIKGGSGAGGKSNSHARLMKKITGSILYIFFTIFQNNFPLIILTKRI